MIDVDGHHLSLADVVRVARDRAAFRIPDDAMQRVEAARSFLERCVDEGRTIYGVNTGIGHLARVTVQKASLDDLQRNIVLSHAAGTGPDLDDDEVRGILLLKINLFAKGVSGVRPELVRHLAAMLAADVLPVVPAKGSLGASGDLAPLAHVALGVIGEGEARCAGTRMPAARALAEAGLAPLRLSFKEGLGLINGCSSWPRGSAAPARRGSCFSARRLRGRRRARRVGAPSTSACAGVRMRATRRRLCRLLRGAGARAPTSGTPTPCAAPQILGGVASVRRSGRRPPWSQRRVRQPAIFADTASGRGGNRPDARARPRSLRHRALRRRDARQVNRLLNPALSEGSAVLAPRDGLNPVHDLPVHGGPWSPRTRCSRIPRQRTPSRCPRIRTT